MTQVGQTQSLGARLPGQVVLWGEGWVKQGVQGGVVEVVAWGERGNQSPKSPDFFPVYSLLCLEALASLGTELCLSGVLD